MRSQTYHTGRTELVLEFLARNANQAFSAREVRDEVEPGGSVDIVSATLGNLAGSGRITRLGAGKGNVHFCWPIGAVKPDRRRDRATQTTPAKRAQVIRKAARPAPKARKPADIATAVRASRTKRIAAPRRIEANFPAPLATVDHAFDPRRMASARLAADIAEFQRRGGHIEQLGITKIFHHPDDCQE